MMRPDLRSVGPGQSSPVPIQQRRRIVLGQALHHELGQTAHVLAGTRAATPGPPGRRQPRGPPNPSACAEAWSSHCWSSTPRINGFPPPLDSGPARPAPRPGTVRTGPALRPKAVAQRLPLRNRGDSHDLASAGHSLMRVPRGQLHLRRTPAARATRPPRGPRPPGKSSRTVLPTPAHRAPPARPSPARTPATNRSSNATFPEPVRPSLLRRPLIPECAVIGPAVTQQPWRR